MNIYILYRTREVIIFHHDVYIAKVFIGTRKNQPCNITHNTISNWLNISMHIQLNTTPKITFYEHFDLKCYNTI